MTTRAPVFAGAFPAAGASADLPRIPFARLVRVEWDKCLDTRAARWLLGVAALITVLVMLIPLSFPGEIDQFTSVYLAFSSIGFALLLPVVLILSLTSEWTQRTVLVTFTQEPRRDRVLSAKLVSGLILAIAAAAFGTLVALGAMAIADWGLDRSVVADRGWGVLLLGFVLFSVLNSLMAMGLAAIVQSSAAAIVCFYLLPTVWGIVFSIGPLKDASTWLDTSQTFTWVQEAKFSGHIGQIVVSALLWVVVPLAAGFVRTVRREVS